MKLYFFAGDWYVPGQQPKGACRRDLPSKPAELAHWLNHRRVPIEMPLHAPPAAEPSPTRPPAEPGLPERSIAIDEAFDELPLARQLDLAARAMENARTRIRG